MLKPAFIDLSHHNTIPQSLIPAAKSGILGVIHKATEGTGYVDDTLDNRHHLAQEADMLWGVYHFVRPGDMAGQVHHFMQTAGPYSDENTLWCLDWEDSGVSLDDAVEFLRRLEQLTGRLPVVYSGHVLKEALAGRADPRISKYRLWLAQYASQPQLPPGWDTYWGWQYTDQGSVDGINSPVDLNAYEGNVDELCASWSGSGEAPTPVPPPIPEGVVVTVIVPPGVRVRIETRDE